MTFDKDPDGMVAISLSRWDHPVTLDLNEDTCEVADLGHLIRESMLEYGLTRATVTVEFVTPEQTSMDASERSE